MAKTKTMADLFKQQRSEWLDSARATAKKLLRGKYFITIEDVLAINPRPQFVHRNTTGLVFNHSDFVNFGMARSTRPAMNGRMIMRWRIRAGSELTKKGNYRDNQPDTRE